MKLPADEDHTSLPAWGITEIKLKLMQGLQNFYYFSAYIMPWGNRRSVLGLLLLKSNIFVGCSTVRITHHPSLIKQLETSAKFNLLDGS